MKTENVYESPSMEIIGLNAEQAVFSTSLTGEGINDWEDM